MSAQSGSGKEVDFNHWLLRFLALVIDSIPLSIVAYLLFIFVIVPSFFTRSIYGFLTYSYVDWYAWWLLFPLIFGIFALLYFIIMEMTIGATIGKKLLGLQVQMANGSKVTFDKSLIRNVSKLFSPFLILDWLVAVVSPGPDPHQKYTDRIARTTVVSVKQVFGQAPPPPPPPPTT